MRNLSSLSYIETGAQLEEESQIAGPDRSEEKMMVNANVGVYGRNFP